MVCRPRAGPSIASDVPHIIVLDSSCDEEEEEGSAEPPAARKGSACDSNTGEILVDKDEWTNISDTVSQHAYLDRGIQTGLAIRADRRSLPITDDDCLNRLLEVFPDIAHDHVLRLCRSRVRQGTCGPELCDVLVAHILDSGQYPKERDRRLELKRKKREDTDGMEQRDDLLAAGEHKKW